MTLDPVEALERLVAIPSVNPMGRQAADPSFGEARLTEHLEAAFSSLGLATWRQPVLPGRENLLAWLEGDVPPDRGGRIVLLDAHQDTVPVEGMTIEPFRPERREGRLYGRGACDDKGGLAAILAAVARLAADRPPGLPTILVACTVNEEYGFSGAKQLADLWTEKGDRSNLRQAPGGRAPTEGWSRGKLDLSPFSARKPDAAVALEPTGLDVVVAHKGVIRWQCHARGRAAHSSQPEAGRNAIYLMARTVTALERLAAALPGGPAHPLCGPATLSVGTIHGGTSVNTVPDRCTIEIDYRLPPGQDPQAARNGLIASLAQQADLAGGLEHAPPYMEGLPLSDELSGPLAERLAAVVTAVAGGCGRTGVPYASNAAFYAAVGVPTVVFGPGSLHQAHTADEWIPLDELYQAAEVLYRFCQCRPHTPCAGWA
ncbi:MAG: M20 family metallopeptidase [Thermoguttaceae bacterium]|jgi:acetylornithine deacetylase